MLKLRCVKSVEWQMCQQGIYIDTTQNKESLFDELVQPVVELFEKEKNRWMILIFLYWMRIFC